MSINENLFGFDLLQKKSLELWYSTKGGSTTVTSANITDATATGRSVLTAANAAAALTAVGGLSPSGSGASLTALNATQLTTGTVPVARLSNATTAARGVVLQSVAQANFAGADLAALIVELNTFLGKLRTAGVVAP